MSTIKKTGNADACLTGLCEIKGHTVAIAIIDFSFMGGSMGEVVGEKITRTVELAQEKTFPSSFSRHPAARACMKAPSHSCKWLRLVRPYTGSAKTVASPYPS